MISFQLGCLEFFIAKECEYIDIEDDAVVGIRFLNNWEYVYCPDEMSQMNKKNDFLAFFCGGKRAECFYGYEFLNLRAKNHFIDLLEGFNNGQSEDDCQTAVPPWVAKDNLDDIPF